jgi:transglutaminase superfamily protein
VKPITPLTLDKLPPGQQILLAAEVLRAYTRVRWVMRNDDAERAVRRLRIETRGPVQHTELENDVDRRVLSAWRLAHASRTVLKHLPSDSRCLFHSLTLMCMLERRGISQALVIAVQPRPFGAHAWLEVDGRPILPEADRGYERLLEL